MTHRGAVGSDARDGDGAGVMTSIPHKFFIKNFAREVGVELPPLGQYAVGNLFFKPDEEALKSLLQASRNWLPPWACVPWDGVRCPGTQPFLVPLPFHGSQLLCSPSLC